MGKPDRSGRQDRENERRAHSSRLQTGAHRRPRQLLRATNAIERLHEEFRRRTRTQYLLPNPESACTPCWVLLANGGRGHVRRMDGWTRLHEPPDTIMLDLAA